ncbi:hypothetical protein [Bradyrhizobium sp.]|uniref:hypothetical protein n=1 Tax=Bradyrhizobium sp. TaxID=376 RepID=UPI003D1373F8
MKWKKERDLLIAQTMAFVQSVAGKKATAEAREVPREALIEPTLIKSTPAGEIAEVKRPADAAQIETLQIETLRIETSRNETARNETARNETARNETARIETAQITRPSPVRVSDIRQEIRGRVAAFRAHQELFHRERDDYYNSVVTRLRASTDHASKAPGDHLPKP